jgi:hypothetical protein
MIMGAYWLGTRLRREWQIMKLRVACAILLLFGAGLNAARADAIQFDLSGTMTPFLATGASCSPGCTLGGYIIVDTATGVVTSADVTMGGENPTFGSFTAISGTQTAGNGSVEYLLSDAAHNFFQLDFSATTLVGFNGGSIGLGTIAEYTNCQSCTYPNWVIESGSLTEVASVPGPTVGAGASSFVFAALLLGWLVRLRRHQLV